MSPNSSAPISSAVSAVPCRSHPQFRYCPDLPLINFHAEAVLENIEVGLAPDAHRGREYNEVGTRQQRM